MKTAAAMNAATRLGFALTIAGVLLAISPPLAEPYTLIKLVFLASGGALIWTGLFLRPVARTALDRPLGALAAVMLLSAYASVDPPSSLLGMYPQPFYGLIECALYAALFYAAASVAGDEASREKLARWMTAASIPLSAFGISQRLFGDLLTGIPLPANRITSTIGSPILLGACLVLLVPLALDQALRRKSRLGAAALGLGLVALVMTWARGAWIGAAAAAAAYFWLSGRLRLRRGHALLLLLAAPVLLGLQRGLHKSDSDAERFEMAKTALAAVRARPALGYGPDAFAMPFRRYKTDEFIRVTRTTFTEALNAHDDILQAAVTLGILGLLAYAWLLWALCARLRSALSGSAPDALAPAIAAALLGLFIQAKVNPIPPSALALAAIMAGMICRRRKALPPAAGRAAASLAAVFCAACAVFSARFCAADYEYRKGFAATDASALSDPAFMSGVNDLRRAAELNPWVLEYLLKRCDIIFRVAPRTPPEQGRQLMIKAVDLSAEGVRLHPGSPMAHVLRATAMALSALHIGARLMPDASDEIKTASALDPTSALTLRRRMDIAHAAGDAADYEKARADYLRVIALTGEAPDWRPLIF